MIRLKAMYRNFSFHQDPRFTNGNFNFEGLINEAKFTRDMYADEPGDKRTMIQKILHRLTEQHGGENFNTYFADPANVPATTVEERRTVAKRAIEQVFYNMEDRVELDGPPTSKYAERYRPY